MPTDSSPKELVMIKKTMIAACTALPLLANATTPSVEVGVSTLGVGITGSYRVMDSVVLRGQYNYFTISSDFDESNISYDADLDLSSFGLIADWYPVPGNGFRVSAGAYYNGNKLEGNGTPKSGNEFIIGGQRYTLDSLNAEADFNSFAPYLGIGWTSDTSTDTGFIFSADLGLLYQGSADVSLTASGNGTTLPGFAENLEAEARRVEDELSNLKVYPVASISLGYRF